METVFTVHPIQLAEQLDNAILLSTDKPPVNDTVHLSLSGKHLEVMGHGRYSAGRDSREVNDVMHDGGAGLELIADLPELTELSKALRKLDGVKKAGALVTVELTDQWVELTYGDDVLAANRSDLADEVEGTDEHEGIYEVLEGRLSAPAKPLNAMTVTRDVHQKLGKLKTGSPAQPSDEWHFELIEDELEGGNAITRVASGPVTIVQMAVGVE